MPGDSIRDLFIPDRWRSLNHLKRPLNHPKKVTKNCQVGIFSSGLRLEENADSQTYPVLISFKDTLDFDGKARLS